MQVITRLIDDLVLRAMPFFCVDVYKMYSGKVMMSWLYKRTRVITYFYTRTSEVILLVNVN